MRPSKYFNSRPRMRANPPPSAGRDAAGFQLPPSHEGELHFPFLLTYFSRFQLPPSHEGERYVVPITPSALISTPALA